MIRFENEQQVQQAREGSAKSAMLAIIEAAHSSIPEVSFDAIADCGGDFFLLEPGDDLAAFRLYEEGDPLDLTDLEARNYEFVTLSDDGGTYALYLPTSDLGGPCFFVPNEPWIGNGFRRAVAAAALR